MKKEELIELKNKLLEMKQINDIEKMIPKMSAYDLLVSSSKDRQDFWALNYLGRKYTFRELIEKIDNAAKAFAELGVKEGDVVDMAMLSTPEAIIAFYALNKLGAMVYMVNATHEKNAIREELLDSEAKLLVINDIFYNKDIKDYTNEAKIKKVVTASLDDSMPIGFYGDIIKFKIVKALKSIGNACKSDPKCMSWKSFESLGRMSNKNVKSFYEENWPLMVSSTSGSTGKPKRPLLTNESINSMPIQMGMSCDDFAEKDSILTTLPIWIIYSLFNSIHEPLCLGVTVDLDPLFSSKKVSKRFEQYHFNHWNTIPSYIEDMLKDKNMKNLDLSILKTITTGGDFRSPKLKMSGEEKLRENNSDCEIGQGYGLSETGGCFSYTYKKGIPAESVGIPLMGNKFKIVNPETKEEVGPNESGELYLYSPARMREYYKDPAATAKAFETDENGVVWYRTEDYAHYDEEGRLYLDGRARRIEISRDANGQPTKVFPDKVKQVVSLHPYIKQCEIIMVPDDKRITRPVAYIVLKENKFFNSALIKEIERICKEHQVEKYTLPTEYKVVDEIPKTPGLKPDYDKMKEMYLGSQVESKKLCLIRNKKYC